MYSCQVELQTSSSLTAIEWVLFCIPFFFFCVWNCVCIIWYEFSVANINLFIFSVCEIVCIIWYEFSVENVQSWLWIVDTVYDLYPSYTMGNTVVLKLSSSPFSTQTYEDKLKVVEGGKPCPVISNLLSKHRQNIWIYLTFFHFTVWNWNGWLVVKRDLNFSVGQVYCSQKRMLCGINMAFLISTTKLHHSRNMSLKFMSSLLWILNCLENKELTH